MKKWICLSMLAATAWDCCSAQGLVDFRNSESFGTPDPTGGNRLVYALGSPLNPVTGTGLSGTQYVAELYVGADSGSLNPVTASITRFHTTTTLQSEGNKCRESRGSDFGLSSFALCRGSPL